MPVAFWPRAGTGWALTPLADAQGEGSARDLESRRSREREREGFEGQTSRISGAEKLLAGREACLAFHGGKREREREREREGALVMRGAAILTLRVLAGALKPCWVKRARTHYPGVSI